MQAKSAQQKCWTILYRQNLCNLIGLGDWYLCWKYWSVRLHLSFFIIINIHSSLVVVQVCNLQNKMAASVKQCVNKIETTMYEYRNNVLAGGMGKQAISWKK